MAISVAGILYIERDWNNMIYSAFSGNQFLHSHVIQIKHAKMPCEYVVGGEKKNQTDSSSNCYCGEVISIRDKDDRTYFQ